MRKKNLKSSQQAVVSSKKEITSAPPRSIISTLGSTLRAAWQPKPIPPPVVDPDFLDMSPIERSSEVFRYKLLQLEFALSSGGGLRAWLRLNMLVCFLLGIPALIVVPVVTWLCYSAVTLSGYLLLTATNILYTLLTIVAIVGVLVVFGYALSSLKRRMQQKNQENASKTWDVEG